MIKLLQVQNFDLRFDENVKTLSHAISFACIDQYPKQAHSHQQNCIQIDATVYARKLVLFSTMNWFAKSYQHELFFPCAGVWQ